MPDRISYPSMGGYSKLLERLGDYLDWDIIPPPPATEATIERGARYLNELMCLPAKVGLGQFIEACEKGANKLLMFDSCGQCRLKCYWILQQRALAKLGFSATVYPIRLGMATPGDLHRVDPSLPYWKAWRAFIRIMADIYHSDQGEGYDIPEDGPQVKIGVVGEIFTLLEPGVNKRLIEKIGKMGAYVHNSLPLSYFLFKGLYNRGWMKRKGVDRRAWLAARERAHQCFPKEIGGHGVESIIHTIYYALKGFDGVVHVLPFPCMPESTVAPILDDIHENYGIPVLRLIFDVHSGEAGLDTRLEAFVDILKRKKAAGTKKKLARQNFAPAKTPG